jgi:hypothetical protein
MTGVIKLEDIKSPQQLLARMSGAAQGCVDPGVIDVLTVVRKMAQEGEGTSLSYLL